MANGNNHAKQIVIGEANTLAAKLKNGSAGDAAVQGQAIGLIVKMITPLYEADFVTIPDCDKLRKDLKGAPPKKRPMKIKVGPVAFEGFVSQTVLLSIPSIISSLCIIFAVGKMQNWW